MLLRSVFDVVNQLLLEVPCFHGLGCTRFLGFLQGLFSFFIQPFNYSISVFREG